MPPPPSQRAEIEPPDEITHEAVRGFLHGAFRFGSVSILAHMIMILPHPFKFSPSANTPSTTTGPPAPMQSQSQTQEPSHGHGSSSNPRKPSPFSASLKSRLFYSPLEGFSEWLSPTARIYRGLTPQFKVYLQISAMTLGGVVWAERRVNEYIKMVRKMKRAERLQAQREARYLE
ncbi:hypothetical protein BDV06DRAFT_227497 [Aspergillus oleicola]